LFFFSSMLFGELFGLGSDPYGPLKVDGLNYDPFRLKSEGVANLKTMNQINESLKKFPTFQDCIPQAQNRFVHVFVFW